MSALLRICTAGNVDDGKSTLLGRLLYESRAVYEDQVRSIEAASRNRGVGAIDFSLFTDGLRAEREQGITIDVAYRYFATARRKFILADTPGHEQYTRNMATGASTADVAIVLVDAQNGIQDQSRRHARIAQLLGIKEFVLAVNKMDLVGFDQDVFAEISEEFSALTTNTTIQAIPISALLGDNVTAPSNRTPWYSGPNLLSHLESIELRAGTIDAPFRYPVQMVLRPNKEFRGFAGRIASGIIRPGDAVTAWPSGISTNIERIVTRGGDLEVATSGMSVVLTLQDELDLSRGDMLAVESPTLGSLFNANIVWMDERPLEPRRLYRLKHTTQTVAAEVGAPLRLNEIGNVTVSTSTPLIYDSYADNRTTGSFVLIDVDSHFTCGAGMILGATSAGSDSSLWKDRAKSLVHLVRTAPDDESAIRAVGLALENFFK